MNRRIANALTCTLISLLFLSLFAQTSASQDSKTARTQANTDRDRGGQHWVGTWAAAAQPVIPGTLEHFQNQTLRLIVHISAGGKQLKIGRASCRERV